MIEMNTMNLTRNSPEILRRDQSYHWAEACLQRAIDTGNQHRARRAAMLTMALHKRMDDLVFSTVETYR